MMPANHQQESVLALYEEGFRLFPLGSPNIPIPYRFLQEHGNEAAEKWPKMPAIASWREYQKVAPEESDIRAWLLAFPGCNWAIITGPEIIVIDADNAAAVDFVQNGPLTRTPWAVRTAKGKHFYYSTNKRLEIRNSANAKNRLDIRGHGGYVVAPGSLHAGGKIYHWERDLQIAQSIHDLPSLCESDLVEINRYSLQKEMESSGARFSFCVDDVTPRADGSSVSKGGRNNACASLVGQYIHSGMGIREIKEIIDSWNSTNTPPLSEPEINKTIASTLKTSLTNHPDRTVPITSSAPKVKSVTPRVDVKIPTMPGSLYAMPGALGQFVEWVNATARKPQPVFAINAALALAGVVAGQKFETATGLRPNNFLISIGPTACGKEHARTQIKRVLADAALTDRMGGEDFASGAGLIAAVNRSPAILFQLDEFGLMLQSVMSPSAQTHHAQIVQNLMKLHSAASSSFTTAEYADQKTNTTKVVQNPCVTLHCTTTASTFFKAVGSQHVLNGFLNRFVVLETDNPNVRPQRPAILAVPGVVSEWVRALHARSSIGNSLEMVMPECPFTLTNSEASWGALDSMEDWAEEKIRTHRETGLDSLYGRSWEHAAKIAALLQLSIDPESTEVGLDATTWGIDFVRFSTDWLVARSAGEVGESPFDVLLRKVLARVESKGEKGIDKSVLLKNTNLPAKDLEAILRTLADRDQIAIDVIPGIRKPKTIIISTEFIQKEGKKGE